MLKTAFRFPVTLLFFLFTCSFLPAQEADFEIVFYAGNPEINRENNVGGLASLMTLLNSERQNKWPVLFLHGGGAIAPSTLSSFDKGAHMIDLLNRLDPDAMSVTKSALAYKEDELTLRSQESGFPFISSNLYDPLTGTVPEGIEPHIMITRGGLRIGILSIIDPEVGHEYLPGRVQAHNAEDAINRSSRSLKEKGAEFIVMMTEYPISESAQLQRRAALDLVLLAESENRDRTSDSGNIYIEHNREDYAAIISLFRQNQNRKPTWRHTVRYVPLSQYQPEKSVQKDIDGYLSKLRKLLGVQIGFTRSELDTREPSVRSGENAFGNLVADSMRLISGAEISLMNGGGIRGDRIYPVGTTLTHGDIHREIPFRNYVVVIQVSGTQLLAGLENGFSRLEDQKGRFPHVSGMKVYYNPTQPPGSRVIRVTIDDTPLEPDRLYSLATVNFLAEGGDGYTAFTNCKHLMIADTKRLLWEYVRDYVAARKAIAPVIEGRLNNVSE